MDRYYRPNAGDELRASQYHKPVSVLLLQVSTVHRCGQIRHALLPRSKALLEDLSVPEELPLNRVSTYLTIQVNQFFLLYVYTLKSNNDIAQKRELT